MSNVLALAGKTALVVGASSGINLAIARRLGEQGAQLAIVSRTPEKIHAAREALVAEGLSVRAWSGDVRDAEAMSLVATEAAKAYGPLDIVVSGAAGNFFATAESMSANAFKTIVDIDLLGTFNVMKAAFPHLRTPGASLISVTAPQGQRAMWGQAHVCAAKAGIDMLTKCLALEWGSKGVRVNAVSPGPIADTEGLSRLASNAEALERVRMSLALPRLGQGRDIGDAVVFLASDAAAYVTGATLDCDGGMRLGDLSTLVSGQR